MPWDMSYLGFMVRGTPNIFVDPLAMAVPKVAEDSNGRVERVTQLARGLTCSLLVTPTIRFSSNRSLQRGVAAIPSL